MPKFDMNEIYGDRLKENAKEIKVAIRKKQWTLKKMLEAERDRINKILNGPEDKGE